MLTNIEKYTTIKGTSIYSGNENWAVGNPAAIDVDITISEQSHPSTDVPMMGTVSIPDQSRIDNITVTANINCDSPEALELMGKGLKHWVIKWVDEVVAVNGLVSVKGYEIRAAGFVSALPESSKSVGGENTGDITMNCLKISKRCVTDGYVEYEIDRVNRILMRNGEDYRSEINELL